MLGSAMVGALSGTPDSMTRTCAPDADSSAARTEPAAPAPTTMKSYRLWSFESSIILNSQNLKSSWFDFYVNWLSRLLHKYSGEVLPNTIENNEPQYCCHRRRGSSTRIHEHVKTNDIHDDRPKQHQRERYESVHQ